MRLSKKIILLIVLLIAMALFTTGCVYTNTWTLRYICILPHDDEFHQNEETLVFQEVSSKGGYLFISLNPDISADVDADIINQTKLLKTNTIYEVSITTVTKFFDQNAIYLSKILYSLHQVTPY
jgi:hypothetical protein